MAHGDGNESNTNSCQSKAERTGEIRVAHFEEWRKKKHDSVVNSCKKSVRKKILLQTKRVLQDWIPVLQFYYYLKWRLSIISKCSIRRILTGKSRYQKMCARDMSRECSRRITTDSYDLNVLTLTHISHMMRNNGRAISSKLLKFKRNAGFR